MTVYNVNNLLGNYYPFFLNNYDLTDLHYLYQVYSPGLSNELVPYFSLKKVSEKTRRGIPCGDNLDILTVCTSDTTIEAISALINKDKDKSAKNLSIKTKVSPTAFLKELLKKEENLVVIDGDYKCFPKIELKEDGGLNSLQKLLLINLRDTLRWKNYRFYPNRFLDVLWTKTEFVVFKICGDKDYMWLEPTAAYKNNDVMLTNPLDVDLSTIDCSSYKWEKSAIKASDLNRLIKKLEWLSFDRSSFI